MGKRQQQWGARKLDQLRSAFGRVCQICGAGHMQLEFHCLEPQGDAHHRAGVKGRATFYTREARRGNLTLLCSSCHARTHGADVEQPF